MKPDIREFTNNKMSIEEQLGLRLYNLEQHYKPQFIVRWIMSALEVDDYQAFDDEFIRFGDDPKDRMYLNAVQIIRYFGKEMVTRFITFNYEQEINEIRKAG